MLLTEWRKDINLEDCVCLYTIGKKAFYNAPLKKVILIKCNLDIIQEDAFNRDANKRTNVEIVDLSGCTKLDGIAKGNFTNYIHLKQLKLGNNVKVVDIDKLSKYVIRPKEVVKAKKVSVKITDELNDFIGDLVSKHLFSIGVDGDLSEAYGEYLKVDKSLTFEQFADIVERHLELYS